MEKKNAKVHPEVFYCKHMYAGLAGYENETILVDLDCMKKLAKSFGGKPVYVFHQDVDLETIEKADGWVSDCWYNELDGWLWAKFVAVTDAAREAIKEGWSVSNAYVPTEWGAGGTYTNIQYDRKIVDGQFTHLALVPNPRYEAAAIMGADEYDAYMAELKAQKEMKNSKEKKLMFFKRKKEAVTALDGDLSEVMLELKNGKEVSVQEMIEAVENAAKKNEAEKEEKLNMDMEIEVGEDKMPLKELINKYMNMCKENSEDESEKENAEDEEDAEKENEADKEEAEKENEADKEDEKTNSKYFEELKNAESANSKGGITYQSWEERKANAMNKY